MIARFAGVPQLGFSDLDPSLLQLLRGRQLLTLAAAALHVPALHAAQLEAMGQLPPAAIDSAATAIQLPLVTGTSICLSSGQVSLTLCVSFSSQSILVS